MIPAAEMPSWPDPIPRIVLLVVLLAVCSIKCVFEALGLAAADAGLDEAAPAAAVSGALAAIAMKVWFARPAADTADANSCTSLATCRSESALVTWWW
jgi:hypothetical protein